MRRVAFLGVFLLAGVVATPARADENADRAERLFNEAMALVKRDKAPEACPLFEESQKLDPAIGTQFNLADCYEKIGKVAAAYRLFTDLRATLKRVGDPRAPQAAARVTALEGRVPKLTIDVPWAAKVEGLVVQLDDTLVERAQLGAPMPIEPGTHKLTVRAARKRPFAKDVVAELSKAHAVTVPELEDESPQIVAVENPANARRTLAVFVAGAGAAALGTGIVLGIVANANYDDAVKEGHCREPDSDEPTGCTIGTAARASRAKDLGTVGTVVGGVGVAAIVTGAVLWLTAPRRSERAARTNMHITPTVAVREGAGVQLWATF